MVYAEKDLKKKKKVIEEIYKQKSSRMLKRETKDRTGVFSALDTEDNIGQ